MKTKAAQTTCGYPYESFLLRVAWSCAPDTMIRRGEVTADMGIAAPNPPLTRDEMESVVRAAKMAVLKCVRTRRAAK